LAGAGGSPAMCCAVVMVPPQLSSLIIRHDEGTSVAEILLNRPHRLNALSRVLLAEIVEACDWVNSRHDLKVVVVRGEGRAFCAGFDLDDFTQQASGVSPRETADLGRLAAEALTEVRPLTIAAVHGHCVGGGVVLAASCDLRIASTDAVFSIPEVDLGIPLAWGGIPRLVREIGPALTKELVLTCRPFDAAEAKEVRFVNRVVPTENLLEAAHTLAGQLSAKPGFALRTTKQQVNAVTEEMIGTRRNANDADTLVVAFADAESRAISRAYLQQRKR
jgi:enoyl-CoA hydratase/carnithine racemase